MSENERLTISYKAVYRLSRAPARFQARMGKLPNLVFSLPTLDLITWVCKDRPAITYKYKLIEVVTPASPSPFDLALRVRPV